MSKAALPTSPIVARLGPDAARVPVSQSEVVACWSAIGVYGDGTCSELKGHIHCHHCPVFSAAGLRLLNRALPAGYRAERTRQYATTKRDTESNTGSAVVFRVHGEWLALPTAVLQEVSDRKIIHSLPHRRRGFVLGLANVRGELLVCVSLGHLLRMQGIPEPETFRRSHARLLVVHYEGIRSAFPVDEVHGPLRFPGDVFQSAPRAVGNGGGGCLEHVICWEERTVGLLDPELLFSKLSGPFA